MVRLFGTNGIRWVIGSREPEFSVRLGLCAGSFYGKNGDVAIGMDTRTTGPSILKGVVSGLLSSGCSAIDLGIVPTPLVQFAVREMGLNGGLMVTASHNPPEFNGMKFFAGDGTELSRDDEDKVERHLIDGPLAVAEWDGVGKYSTESHVQSSYRDAILSFLDSKEWDLRVVVDCANGAAIGYTPEILTRAGCSVLSLNSQPDGRFPGRMPEPTEDNIAGLMSAVREHGASFGIAHDGDSDRATFVDDKGNYVTGDRSLAIFAGDALERKGGGTVVVPINTSRVVEDVVRAKGGKVEYTVIGSPVIARRMMEIDAVLGGEGNGGVIFPEHLLCRDGIMAAVQMLNIISHRGPLSNLVAELPKYCIKSDKVRCVPESKERIMERARNDAEGDIIDIDGVKVIDGERWSLIRASGTEPIIRVTVEAGSENECNNLLKEKVEYLKEVIRDLS